MPTIDRPHTKAEIAKIHRTLTAQYPSLKKKIDWRVLDEELDLICGDALEFQFCDNTYLVPTKKQAAEQRAAMIKALDEVLRVDALLDYRLRLHLTIYPFMNSVRAMRLAFRRAAPRSFSYKATRPKRTTAYEAVMDLLELFERVTRIQPFVYDAGGHYKGDGYLFVHTALEPLNLVPATDLPGTIRAAYKVWKDKKGTNRPSRYPVTLTIEPTKKIKTPRSLA